MDRDYPGTCSSCCECPLPAFAYVSRAATKTKVGFSEFVNPSTPPKYYLTETWSSDGGGGCTGGIAGCIGGAVGDPCNGTVSTAGTATFDRLTGACTGYDTQNGGARVEACGPYYFFTYCYGNCYITDAAFTCSSDTETYTQTTYSSSSTCTGCSATASMTLSNEYTTAQLETDTLARLPTTWGPLSAFGGYPGDLASTELSSNEASYSVMDSKYQLAHQIPPGGTYELTWVTRFTPDGGGAVVNTPQSYTWDGTIPGNYNQSDPTTWPKSPVFEVDHPSSNGTITLANLTVNCGAGPTTLFS